MACRYANNTDEYHGWECSETEGACMFFVPDEKKCYEEYGEGPLAFEEQDKDFKEQILAELESTRYIECPYPQCDEMYHAWNEAFDAMEKVVKKITR